MSFFVQSKSARSPPRLAVAHAAARPSLSSRRSSEALPPPPLPPAPEAVFAPAFAQQPKQWHKTHHRTRRQRSPLSVLTRQEMVAVVQERVKRTAPFLSPGAVVVYEFLNDAREWHWSLGTVQQADTHTVTLQKWSCTMKDVNSDVVEALGREGESVRLEIEEHQAAILALRAELGAVRTHNESEMNAAREAIEERRRGMAAAEDALRRNATRDVAVRLNSGTEEDDTLAAVLRAALSIVEDYVPTEPLPWDVVWATVCDPVFLQRCINYDVGYDMSVEQKDEVEACYFGSKLITEEKVHRAAARMAIKAPDMNEVLCATANWVFTQLSVFHIYQQCANTQSCADNLQQRLTYHVNALKEMARKLRQVQAQLRVLNGAPGSPSNVPPTPRSDVRYTFVPLDDATTQVLRCAIICPLSTSRPQPQQPALSNSLNSSDTSQELEARNGTSSAQPRRGSHSNGNGNNTTAAANSASTTPDVVLLGQEELDEIATRALHTRPQLFQVVQDLEHRCRHQTRELELVKTLAKEDAARRRSTTAAERVAAVAAAAVATSSSASLGSITASTSSTSHLDQPSQEQGHLKQPLSESTPEAESRTRPYRIQHSTEEDNSEESDEEADIRAFQKALLSLQHDLQAANHESEQLKRALQREAGKNDAIEAEFARQLHALRTEYEDALGRLEDAKIRCEAMEAENIDLEKALADLAGRAHSREQEPPFFPNSLRIRPSAATLTDDNGLMATPRPVTREIAGAISRGDASTQSARLDQAPTPPACVSHHRKQLEGEGWPEAMRRHPDSLRAAAAVDAANACHVLNNAISDVQLGIDGHTVEFDVSHSPDVHAADLAAQISRSPFPESQRVLRDEEGLRIEQSLLDQLAQRDTTIQGLESQLADLGRLFTTMRDTTDTASVVKNTTEGKPPNEWKSLEVQLCETQKENESLHAAIGELEGQLRATQQETTRRAENNYKTIEALQQQINNANDKLSHAAVIQQQDEAEIQELRQELSDIEKRLADAEKQHADKDAEVADLRQQVADAEQREVDKDAEIADLRQQVADAEQREVDKDAEIADLRQQVADAEQRLAEAEQQHADKDAALTDAEQQHA
ncbi:hypothetical protein NQL31_007594, partial [Lotmaria passim]